MSATMTDDVEMLKGLALRNPVRLPPLFFLVSSQIGFAGYAKVGGGRRRCCQSNSIRREVLFFLSKYSASLTADPREARQKSTSSY
jgi:hypothetical protein